MEEGGGRNNEGWGMEEGEEKGEGRREKSGRDVELGFNDLFENT